MSNQWEYKTMSLTTKGDYLWNNHYLRTDGEVIQYRVSRQVDRPVCADYSQWIASLSELVADLDGVTIDLFASVDEDYNSADIDFDVEGWKAVTVEEFPELAGQEIAFKTITYSFA